jgi:acetyl esterase/lipase
MEAAPNVQPVEVQTPIPSSISPEAQRYLAGLRAPAPWPPAEDVATWREIAAKDAADGAAAAAGAEGLPVTRRREEMGGAVVYVARPSEVSGPLAGKVILYFHGGAFVFGSGPMAEAYTVATALRFGAETFGVDYRVPPEHPFPAALDDCFGAYRGLLDRFAPDAIAFVGVSAGAGLAISTLFRARDAGLPMPRCMVLSGPQVDLTESGESFWANRDLDLTCGETAETSKLYAGGRDLADPFLSPLFGDLRGLPPALIVSGTRDIMLSSAVRLHRALRRAGGSADLNIWEAAPHSGFHDDTPEGRETRWETARFVHHHWRRA